MKNMMLISAPWQGKPSWRMIPITMDCPYQECIFDTETRVLAIISKVDKQSYTMVHKIDDNGDPAWTKNNTPRKNGKTYKEERRLMDTYQEYYIEDPEEIKQFVRMFAVEIGTAWENRIIDSLRKTEVPQGEITMAPVTQPETAL